MNPLRIASSAALLALLAGCADEPQYVADDFGSSVRQMIQAQAYNPQAAQRPAAGVQGALDGEKSAAAVKAYRAGKGLSGPSESFTALPLITAPVNTTTTTP